jgi:hypothetical protein
MSTARKYIAELAALVSDHLSALLGDGDELTATGASVTPLIQ